MYEDNDCGEAGIFAKLPKAVAAIANNGVKPVPSLHLMNLLLELIDAPHSRVAARRASCGDMPDWMFSWISISR